MFGIRAPTVLEVFPISGQNSRMYEEDSRVGLLANRCVQQVQEHGSQAVVQAAGEGTVRAEEVQPRQQEGFGPGQTFRKASVFYHKKYC